MREVKSGDFDLRVIVPWVVLVATGLGKITWGNGWVEKRGRFCDASTCSGHGEEENSQERLSHGKQKVGGKADEYTSMEPKRRKYLMRGDGLVLLVKLCPVGLMKSKAAESSSLFFRELSPPHCCCVFQSPLTSLLAFSAETLDSRSANNGSILGASKARLSLPEIMSPRPHPVYTGSWSMPTAPLLCPEITS